MSHYTRPRRKYYGGKDRFAYTTIPLDRVPEPLLACDISGRYRKCSPTMFPDPFEIEEERAKEGELEEARKAVLLEVKHILRRILTAKQQKALQLKIRGYKYSDAGREMGISRQAAAKLIKAATTKLRNHFERNSELRSARDRWFSLLQH